MKTINSLIARSIILGILTTLLFIGSIVGIILGAINQLWVLMGVCIGVTILLFLIVWLPWARLAAFNDYAKTIRVIVVDGVTNTVAIAQRRNCREVDVRKDIETCLNRGWLVGYHLQGDDLFAGDKVIKQKNISVTCPNCHEKTMVPGVKCIKCSKCGYTQPVGE